MPDGLPRLLLHGPVDGTLLRTHDNAHISLHSLIIVSTVILKKPVDYFMHGIKQPGPTGVRGDILRRIFRE